MASFRKRGNKWSVRISYQENGKQKQKEKSGFRTKAEAQKYAIEQEQLLNKGILLNSKDILFCTYFKKWYETFKADNISPSTLRRYSNIEKRIKEYFNDVGMQKITRTDYQKFINWYGASHAPETVSKLNSIIKSCVQSALLDNQIQIDFTQKISLVSNKDKIVKVEYLNVDEIKTLLWKTVSKLNRHFTSRYMIVTAILTGMRYGEVAALTWDDIDFENQTININKSWDNIFGLKPTKTESSIRKITVSNELLDLLSELKKNNHKEIFKNQYGTIPSSNAVNKTLREMMKECNLTNKNFTFHSLRHAHVAYLIFEGVDIYAISKRLGHKDITMTLNRYAYLMNEHEEKENELIRQKITKLFAQGQNKG